MAKIDEIVATSIFELVYGALEQRQENIPSVHSSPHYHDDGYEEEDLLSTSSVRRLELSHFPFLCKLLSLSLDDMSFYVLAYLLQCKGHVPLTILEYEFVTGLTALELDLSANEEERVLASSMAALISSISSGARRFHCADVSLLVTAVLGLKRKIESCNTEIRRDNAKCVDFYHFLYSFVLRHNEEEEANRRDLAVDLWRLFFASSNKYDDPYFEGGVCWSSSSSSSSRSCSSSQGNAGERDGSNRNTLKGRNAMCTDGYEGGMCGCYKHYKSFSQMEAWLSFVNSPLFYDTTYDEEADELGGGHYVSADLWQQLFLFADVPVDQYTLYDPYSAWPNAIDDFMAVVLNEV